MASKTWVDVYHPVHEDSLGSLNYWSLRGGMTQLAKDFKGSADFCVMGDTVYVPDLVKSEVRIIRLGK